MTIATGFLAPLATHCRQPECSLECREVRQGTLRCVPIRERGMVDPIGQGRGPGSGSCRSRSIPATERAITWLMNIGAIRAHYTILRLTVLPSLPAQTLCRVSPAPSMSVATVILRSLCRASMVHPSHSFSETCKGLPCSPSGAHMCCQAGQQLLTLSQFGSPTGAPRPHFGMGQQVPLGLPSMFREGKGRKGEDFSCYLPSNLFSNILFLFILLILREVREVISKSHAKKNSYVINFIATIEFAPLLPSASPASLAQAAIFSFELPIGGESCVCEKVFCCLFGEGFFRSGEVQVRTRCAVLGLAHLCQSLQSSVFYGLFFTLLFRGEESEVDRKSIRKKVICSQKTKNNETRLTSVTCSPAIGSLRCNRTWVIRAHVRCVTLLQIRGFTLGCGCCFVRCKPTPNSSRAPPYRPALQISPKESQRRHAHERQDNQ